MSVRPILALSTGAAIVALSATLFSQTPNQGDGIGTPKFATVGSVTFRTARTVPYWSSSFTYQGTTYPYTMVGTAPSSGTPTTVDSAIIPIDFVFADGRSLDGSTKVGATLNSPIFSSAAYTSGTTQWGDAIQRATFWPAVAHTDWHVRLGNPVVYPVQTIDVPKNHAVVLVGRNSGALIGLIDESWFSAQLQSILGSLHIAPTTFPIFGTYNIFLYVKSPADCCILGYHAVTSSRSGNGDQQVQTYAFASWTDPGIFSEPGIRDVHALSHEVSEWMNDPFVTNVVPPWQTPSAPQYGCTGLLETGDPLVGDAYPVSLNGFTYHPQTEALLPWFARQAPSTAIDGAYSYPDTSVLTSVATGCS